MNGVFQKKNYSMEWRAKGPVGLVRQFSRDVRYSMQRIRKGYCDRDIWSIDGWFLSVMPDMLRQLKATRHGSPGVLGENYKDENGIMQNDKCHEEWDQILDEMIFLLSEANKETCQRINPYEETFFSDKDSENMDMTERYLQEERKLDAYRDDCKNKGLALFSKWFWHLWD